MPAWKLLLGRGEPQSTTTDASTQVGWALLVPPGLMNTATAFGSYTAVFLDPGWFVGEAPDRVVDLGRRRAAAILDEIDSDPDSHRPPAALNGVLEPDGSELGAVIRSMADCARLDGIAAGLGVSPQQLRRLVRQHSGSTFSEIRRWARLTRAVEILQTSTIAAAAVDAGFADQAHLTRTSARMLGRTLLDR